MTTVDRWQLPDGVEEVLPEQAAAVEHLRRALLDLFASWGYQLVIPPLMEFTESTHSPTALQAPAVALHTPPAPWPTLAT